MKESNTNLNFVKIEDRILFEDNHLVIVNKLPSEIVQGDKTGDKPLLNNVKTYIKEKYHKPGEVFLGLVHRIDRPVSGAVIFARTSKALTRMNQLIHERKIEKKYWAIVGNKPPANKLTLEHYIRKNEKENKSYIFQQQVVGAVNAIMSFELIAQSERYFLLEVILQTGRHHQIRAQLAHIGCPIKGDLKYGDKRSNPDASIGLHARSLKFIHPVKNEEIEIIAPLPKNKTWQIFCDKDKG